MEGRASVRVVLDMCTTVANCFHECCGVGEEEQALSVRRRENVLEEDVCGWICLSSGSSGVNDDVASGSNCRLKINLPWVKGDWAWCEAHIIIWCLTVNIGMGMWGCLECDAMHRREDRRGLGGGAGQKSYARSSWDHGGGHGKI
jgi:hypothetical protein